MNILPHIIVKAPLCNLDSKSIKNRVSFCSSEEKLKNSDGIKNELHAWHKNLKAPSSIYPDLESLFTGESFCTVTGQQTGIGVSPLLAVYKFITNEIIAEKLSSLLHKTVVPVFWLQTEDHDLEEISSLGVLTAELDFKKFRYQSKDIDDTGKNRKSIGSLPFPDTISPELDTFLRQFYREELLQEVSSLINSTFSISTSFHESFARCMYQFFPESKTVFIDPRLPCFDDRRRQIMTFAFDNWQDINSDLRHTSTLIKIRENSPLFFMHAEGKNEDRYRLEYNGKDFEIPGLSLKYTSEEIYNQIQNYPEKFSTSALLRPLFQDTLLPSLCYVAGSTEMQYLKETQPLYHRLGIPNPKILPRAHVSIVDNKLFEQTKALIPDPLLLLEQEGSKVRSAILKNLLKEELSSESIMETIQPLLNQVFTSIGKPALDTDQTLENPLQKTIQSTQSNIQKFLDKYDQALLRKNEITTSRVNKLLLFSHPDNKLQERQLSALWLYMQYGRSVFEALYNSVKNAYNETSV